MPFFCVSVRLLSISRRNSFLPVMANATPLPVSLLLQRAAQKPRAEQPELAACKTLASSPVEGSPANNPLSCDCPSLVLPQRTLPPAGCYDVSKQVARPHYGSRPQTPSTRGVKSLTRRNLTTASSPPAAPRTGSSAATPRPPGAGTTSAGWPSSARARCRGRR